MSGLILTLNAGSSSVKFAAYDTARPSAEPLTKGDVQGLGSHATFSGRSDGGKSKRYDFDQSHGPVDHKVGIAAIIDWVRQEGGGRPVVAVGHRVLHGGPNFSAPALIDAKVLEELRALIPLGPLHQPHNVAGIEAALAAYPTTPQIACFDTAFHRSQPFVNDAFGLPRAYYEEGVRRYGFHGLSYEFIARRLKTVAPAIANERVIVAHLGNGASMCAMRNGKAVLTTMGFTPIDGVLMGTRCGRIDPGVVLYLMMEKKMTASAISDLISKQSGLLGLSGISNDMRALEASDAPAAREAIEYFVATVKREIGSLAAALDGLDAIVFTAGIGEHSPTVREAVLTGMEWIGVAFDKKANAANAQKISVAQSRVAVFVVPTDEERMIAEHAARVAGVAFQA